MKGTLNKPEPEYSFTSPQKQYFSLPFTMIVSMLENATSSHKGFSKLYQICKYFYSKRPILIARNVYFQKITDKHNSEISNIRFDYKYTGDDISKLQIPIWVTKKVYFYEWHDQSRRLLKLFRSSLELIKLRNSALQFDDFVFLTSEKTVKHFFVDFQSYIYHNNTTAAANASIDEILQHLPNIQKFEYFSEDKCTNEMFTKLNKLKFKNKFRKLALAFSGIHSNFNINLFCEFITKNSRSDAKIAVYFDERLNFKFALQNLEPKWKTEAHYDLKQLFWDVDPTWDEIIEDGPDYFDSQ